MSGYRDVDQGTLNGTLRQSVGPSLMAKAHQLTTLDMQIARFLVNYECGDRVSREVSNFTFPVRDPKQAKAFALKCLDSPLRNRPDFTSVKKDRY